MCRFATLQAQCSQLASAENTDAHISNIIAEANEFVYELGDLYDEVQHCFPPHYKIFTVVFKQYHKQLDDMLHYIGCCATELANADILKVQPASWVCSFDCARGALHACLQLACTLLHTRKAEST